MIFQVSACGRRWSWACVDPVRLRASVGALFDRSVLKFSISSTAVQGASLLSGVIGLRWLPVAAAGVWQSVLLVQSYLGFTRLGVLNAANRALPFALGRGDQISARVIAATAQYFEVSRAALEGAVFLLAAVSAWGAGYWRWSLLAMVIAAPAEAYHNYLLSTFRGSRDFDRLARLQLLHALLWLASPAAVYLFGFHGLCLYWAIRVTLIATLAHRVRPFRVRPCLNSPMLLGLFRDGIPLFITNYAWNIATTFDKVIILHRGGTAALGSYAPAAAAATAIGMIPTSVGAYLYPQSSYWLGRGDRGRDIWIRAVSAVALSTAAALPLSVVVWWFAPALVSRLFPQYARCLPALRLNVLAGLILGATSVSTILRSFQSWRQLYLYVGLHVALKWVCPWVVSSRGDVLTNVAYGSLGAGCGSAIVALLISYAASRSLDSGRRCTGSLAAGGQ